MKLLHRILGILIAFCLMWILFITSIEAVCYWNPGYFEREYNKYQVLNDLPPMTMEDLLDKVGDGTVDWKTVIRNFYPDLDEAVKAAEKELEEVKI